MIGGLLLNMFLDANSETAMHKNQIDRSNTLIKEFNIVTSHHMWFKRYASKSDQIADPELLQAYAELIAIEESKIKEACLAIKDAKTA